MSEELDDFDNIEGVEMLTIKQYTQLQRPLAEVTGAEQSLVWQKLRGDTEFSCGVYNRHETTDSVANYYQTNAEPDTPETLEADEKSIQGWVYVADYTIHDKSPGCAVFQYYIHARINANNEVEFAAFENVHETKQGNEKITLAEVTGAEQSLVWQKKNCDFKPILRIATKKEAEEKLLVGGKLKISACPQYAGYWVNQSNARYKHGSVTKGLRCYGHVWSYWYAIINNVLYFVGLPLWQGNSTGHLVYGQGNTKSIDTPPTEYDLSSKSIGNSEFRTAMSLVTDVWLWGAGNATIDTSSKTAGAARILEHPKYADKTEATELFNVVLAKVDKTNVTQYHRGDIIADIGAFSGMGGAFNIDGSIKSLSSADYWSQRQNNSLTYSSGSSGYIAQKTKDVPDGQGMVAVYFLTSYFIGNNLTIYCQGARFIRSVVWDSGYDFVLNTTDPNPDTPDPDNPDPDNPGPEEPTPPGPNKPSPNPPNPNPPLPIPPNPVLQVQGGYIWKAGKGIKIDAKVRNNNSPFVNVNIAYQISVTATPKRKGTLHYPVTIEASADGGGTYKLPPEYKKGSTSILTYGVGGDGDISLTNATTYAGNSVKTSGEFTKNVIVPWHADATFGKCVKTNNDNTINSNIVTATVTNKTETHRMLLSTTLTKQPFEADVTFTVIEVNLNEQAVNEIIKNNTIQKIGSNLRGTLSPSTVNGTSGITKTRPPSITASITNSPQRNLSVIGLTQAVGEISMTVTNQRIDQGTATFNVGNNTTGWYEETLANRATANISG